jgi:hypothetical protein
MDAIHNQHDTQLPKAWVDNSINSLPKTWCRHGEDGNRCDHLVVSYSVTALAQAQLWHKPSYISPMPWRGTQAILGGDGASDYIASYDAGDDRDAHGDNLDADCRRLCICFSAVRSLPEAYQTGGGV